MSPVKKRKQYLIDKLSKLHFWYIKNLDGASLAELEAMHIRVMCETSMIHKWQIKEGVR